ncbi:MAG: hypothetical protein FJZ98_05790 [Chloroflexi bacterium]|nr:hypothetical protein [Chloroflexota bacterium]
MPLASSPADKINRMLSLSKHAVFIPLINPFGMFANWKNPYNPKCFLKTFGVLIDDPAGVLWSSPQERSAETPEANRLFRRNPQEWIPKVPETNRLRADIVKWNADLRRGLSAVYFKP